METELAKPEWGLKRTCLSCGTRFYDMQRDPIKCPTFGAELDPLSMVRPRRARAAASQAKAKAEEKAFSSAFAFAWLAAARARRGLTIDRGSSSAPNVGHLIGSRCMS